MNKRYNIGLIANVGIRIIPLSFYIEVKIPLTNN